MKQNRINHVALVLDKSSSMEESGLTKTVIQVADNLVSFLAKRSKDMDQETRITIYTFADKAECVVYDMDVLRLPSLAEFYQPYGWTALIDATSLAIDDLAMTPQKYGDHAFLVYVLTDGAENASGGRNGRSWWVTPRHVVQALSQKIAALPNNWTMAALVPNTQGKLSATDYGFLPGNVEIWDATSKAGMEETGRRVEAATASFMANPTATKQRVTNLFDISGAVVNADAILRAGLIRVDYDEYKLIPVPPVAPKVSDEEWALKHPGKKRRPPIPWGGEIGEFVRKVNGGSYEVGKAYYPLTDDRSFIVQPNKKIIVLDTEDDRVYRGSRAAVRKLLNGLPDDKKVRIRPTASDRFRVYVESTSDNRSLSPRAPLLLFK